MRISSLAVAWCGEAFSQRANDSVVLVFQDAAQVDPARFNGRVLGEMTEAELDALIVGFGEDNHAPPEAA